MSKLTTFSIHCAYLFSLHMRSNSSKSFGCFRTTWRLRLEKLEVDVTWGKIPFYYRQYLGIACLYLNYLFQYSFRNKI